MNWCQNAHSEITTVCLFNNVITLTNEFFNLHNNTIEGTITEMTDVTTINDIIWQSNTNGDMINSNDVNFSVEFFNITDGILKLKN